jgi:N-carbamoylputrescine amidase
MKVAVAQLSADPLAPDLNARRGSVAIREAARQGAALVVLPELLSSGYVMDRKAVAAIAEDVSDPGICLRSWAQAARAECIAVVAGFAERVQGGRLYNSVAVINSQGTLVGVYRKLHLFGAEKAIFEQGDLGLPVFEVDGVSLGVLVCYDLRFPECMRILAMQGAEVIALPAAWVSLFDAQHDSPSDLPGQVTTAGVLCNLNQVFLAAADRVGKDLGVEFLGRSVICSPFGTHLLGPLDGQSELVAVADIDLTEVSRARRRGPLTPLEDRRTDVYGSLLGYQPSAAAHPHLR